MNKQVDLTVYSTSVATAENVKKRAPKMTVKGKLRKTDKK
jgi:hypothetical protein